MSAVINFIQDIQYQYFEWLKMKEESFPLCCYISSEVLGSYVQETFRQGKVCLGKKIKCSRIHNFHEWIEIGDYVIDFTKFQYSRKRQGRKFEDFTPQKTYDICINNMQDGKVIFAKDRYYEEFKPKLIVEPRFKHMAKVRDFEEYLNAVVMDKTFKEFSFWDNISPEDRYWEKN